MKLWVAGPALMLATTSMARNMDFIHDDSSSVGGIAILIVLLIGAAIGYFLERAINKSRLDKAGANYSSEYLGGKVGAIIGAIALPLLIGLLR